MLRRVDERESESKYKWCLIHLYNVKLKLRNEFYSSRSYVGRILIICDLNHRFRTLDLDFFNGLGYTLSNCAISKR